MSALNVFGVGAACLGLAGTGITLEAGRQVLTLPGLGRHATDWPLLLGLVFIAVVDIGVVVTGAGLAQLSR